MISFLVRLRFAPEDRAEIAEILRLLTQESRREPGCVSYIPHHGEGDPDTIVISEQYGDDLPRKAHRKWNHSKGNAVEGLYQKMKSRELENLVALVS